MVNVDMVKLGDVSREVGKMHAALASRHSKRLRIAGVVVFGVSSYTKSVGKEVEQ